MHSMSLVQGSLNPSMYWGVRGRGFKYGDAVLMDPEEAKPILAVIDSGTTAVMLPSKIFELFMNELAKKFKDDHSVSMICTRSPEAPFEIDICFFNNASCSDLYHKVDPIKFVFDKSVFELSSQAFLKDDVNVVKATGQRTPACVIDLRSGKDQDKVDERRFLMGNTFLKNYYSVYDYDW